MNNSLLVSLLCALAAAAPFLDKRSDQGLGYIPNYPGIQFSNGKIAITVFSDLHFGERKLLLRKMLFQGC